MAYGEITGNAAVKEAYAEAGVYQPNGLMYEARGVAPAEEVVSLAKAPLVHQPGTVWEYSLAVDVLGRVVEKASGKRLGDFLEQRLFAPLGMVDTGFSVPQADAARLAEPLATDPATGTPNKLLDVSAPPANDSGGAGAVSTASDYALVRADAAEWRGARRRAHPQSDHGAPDGVRPSGHAHPGAGDPRRAAARHARLHLRPGLRGARG